VQPSPGDSEKFSC